MKSKNIEERKINISSIKNQQLEGLQINSSIRQEQRENDLTDRSSNKNQQQLKLSSLINVESYGKGREMLSEAQMANLKLIFEKFSSTKTIKKPPRSKLNAYGVRQIMVSQPQIDVSLSQKQFIELFNDAQIPLHKQTISHLFSVLNRNKVGKGVTFKDLQTVFRNEESSQDDEEYMKIFKLYDRKRRGYFDFEDYKFVCEGITKDISQAQMGQAFSNLDKEKSNRISYQRFLEIMKG